MRSNLVAVTYIGLLFPQSERQSRELEGVPDPQGCFEGIDIFLSPGEEVSLALVCPGLTLQNLQQLLPASDAEKSS